MSRLYYYFCFEILMIAMIFICLNTINRIYYWVMSKRATKLETELRVVYAELAA